MSNTSEKLAALLGPDYPLRYPRIQISRHDDRARLTSLGAVLLGEIADATDNDGGTMLVWDMSPTNHN